MYVMDAAPGKEDSLAKSLAYLKAVRNGHEEYNEQIEPLAQVRGAAAGGVRACRAAYDRLSNLPIIDFLS